MFADSGLGLEEPVLRIVGCSSMLPFALIWSVNCSDVYLPGELRGSGSAG